MPSPVPDSSFRVLRHFRPQWRAIGLIGLVSLVAAQLEAATLVAVVPLAQAVANGNDTSNGRLGPLDVTLTVDQLIIASVFLIVAAAAASILFVWLRARMGPAYAETQRRHLIAEYLAADWPTQRGVRDGRLQQLNNFTSRGAVVLTSLITGLRGVLTLVMFFAIAIVVDWRAALALVVAGSILLAGMRPLSKRARRLARESSATMVDYSEELQDVASNSLELRVFGATDVMRERLVGLGERIRDMRARSGFLAGVMTPTFQFAGLLFLLLAILITSRASQLEVASLGVVALLLLRGLSYGQQVQSAYQSALDAIPAIEWVEDARAEYQAGAVTTSGITIESVGSLTFDSVSYSYDGELDALADINLELHVGETIGVVGPSGSGKSTLAQLLLRIREPSAGEIRVDGQPVGDFSLDSWYEQVTVVPQAPHLFHATVADNIALFRPGVSRAEIEDAARSAGIHDVIEALPVGYETLIGPSFRDLSGGQIQRIGIARALARQASVLVLDEPTSALDVHSEAQIQETLRALHGDVMVIVIAHRLSTLSICDRLVVLNEGRLETAGPLSHVFEHNEFFRTAMDAGALDLAPPAGAQG